MAALGMQGALEMQGLGTEQDLSASARKIAAAAQAGDADSMKRMALMLRCGMNEEVDEAAAQRYAGLRVAEQAQSADGLGFAWIAALADTCRREAPAQEIAADVFAQEEPHAFDEPKQEAQEQPVAQEAQQEAAGESFVKEAAGESEEEALQQNPEQRAEDAMQEETVTLDIEECKAPDQCVVSACPEQTQQADAMQAERFTPVEMQTPHTLPMDGTPGALQVREMEREEKKDGENRKTGRRPLIALIIAVILLLVFLIVFFFGRGSIKRDAADVPAAALTAAPTAEPVQEATEAPTAEPVQEATPTPTPTPTPAPTLAPAAVMEDIQHALVLGDPYTVMGYEKFVMYIGAEDGRITSVSAPMHDERAGAPFLTDQALSVLIGQPLSQAEMDAVAGATLTVNAVNSAIRMAAMLHGDLPQAATPAPHARTYACPYCTAAHD